MLRKVAIVGISGLVGQEMVKVIKEKKLNVEIVGFGSFKRKYQDIEVNKLIDVPKNIDYALFSAGSKISKKWIPEFAKKNIICIDNSSAFRNNSKIPLVVPSVNLNDIKKDDKIISNPNCATIPVVTIINEFNDRVTGFNSVTFQSVSGAGRRGVEALFYERANKRYENSPFGVNIFNNIIPKIGDILENNISEEERKMIYESRKILRREDMKITSSCVRVPIEIGHSISITLEGEDLSVQFIKESLKNSKNKNIILKNIPTPQDIKDTDNILVGRIKEEEGYPGRFSMFIVSDNLRVGAATNAVNILEKLIT